MKQKTLDGMPSVPVPKRPTCRDQEVVEQVARRLLPDVLEWCGEEDASEQGQSEVHADLVYALGDAYEWDGYILAESFSRGPCWSPDARLVEILDEAISTAYDILSVLIPAWVRTYGIEQLYHPGQRVTWVSGGCKRRTGVIAAVNYGDATYTVQDERESYQEREPGFVCGLIVAFENVEVAEDRHG